MFLLHRLYEIGGRGTFEGQSVTNLAYDALLQGMNEVRACSASATVNRAVILLKPYKDRYLKEASRGREEQSWEMEISSPLLTPSECSHASKGLPGHPLGRILHCAPGVFACFHWKPEDDSHFLPRVRRSRAFQHPLR